MVQILLFLCVVARLTLFFSSFLSSLPFLHHLWVAVVAVGIQWGAISIRLALRILMGVLLIKWGNVWKCLFRVGTYFVPSLGFQTFPLLVDGSVT
jgi:hypothetical protein